MKFKIQLWHATNPTFFCPKSIDEVRGKFDSSYKEVHEFAVDAETARDACEIVFEQSQNIYDAWKTPNRSTSIGDVMIIPEVGVYAVDSVGMRDLLAGA